MLWRLWQGGCRARGPLLAARGRGARGSPAAPEQPAAPAWVVARRAGDYMPPSQYDIPLSNKFKFGYAIRVHWELIPIFVTTAFVIFLVFAIIIWSCKNKVDVVFSTHSCNNISRTMNLRRPTHHKLITIGRPYDPWPEMQDVIDKLAVAERRVLLKATQCSYEQREGHPPADF